MWVVNKSIALSVMAITGSQNKIAFMKLQKENLKNVIKQHAVCLWFKLIIGALIYCTMIFLKKKALR